MLFEPEQLAPLVLMVTSASPGEGKTTTSANLAAVFGEAGSSVLVLNCDFRRPSIHEMFGVPDEPRRVQDTAVPGVKVVTNVLADAGANPAQVVAAQRQVISSARSRFDVVILDTAPLLTANDAIELVGAADLVLLVARPDLSTTDTAQRSMDLLNRLDAPLAGVVLVAVAEGANEYYYYSQRGRAPEPTGRGRKAQTGEQRTATPPRFPPTSPTCSPSCPRPPTSRRRVEPAVAPAMTADRPGPARVPRAHRRGASVAPDRKTGWRAVAAIVFDLRPRSRHLALGHRASRMAGRVSRSS